MINARKYFFCFCCALFIMTIAWTGPAIAEPALETQSDPGSMDQSYPFQNTQDPENWGVKDQIEYWLPASAFTQTSDPDYGVGYGGYLYRKSGSNDFWAPLNLPQGVLIKGFTLYYYDTHISEGICAWIMRYYTTTTAQEAMWSYVGCSGANPGYSSVYVNVNLTLDYETGWTLEKHNDCYSVIVHSPVTGELAFRGVKIYYQLQISPAPVTATFTDVPTNYWAFQHIEALADAGITSGCGGGMFCPDDTLTRAQMAVFLAKALGLHWVP